MKAIYTIGHGSRKIDIFISLLTRYEVEYLVDVRSLPYSEFHPQYNRNELKLSLGKAGIRYIFMGDNLGGRPKSQSCYDAEGKVDYEILRTKEFFLFGIEKLKTDLCNEGIIALMCSESNPCECHRSKLIGRVLEREDISVLHITEQGKLKTQAAVMTELTKGLPEIDLFGNQRSFKSQTFKYIG